MIDLKTYELWFVVGSQHLYGDEVITQVSHNAKRIAEFLDKQELIPIKIVYKPVLTTSESISACLQEANNKAECIGCIMWMHTFSPSKMWINGLKNFGKPLLHLHTQFHRDIPWSEIDMAYMNLHQAAHGDREFSHLLTRMNISRKVVVGHWQHQEVIRRIGVWTRAAAAWSDSKEMKIARFGDNMRDVSVTEGDKVAAQMRFGYLVNGYGLGDLVRSVNAIEDEAIAALIEEYDDTYEMQDKLRGGGEQRESLIEAARLELGIESFLKSNGFKAFTDTFENLHGLRQLPGIAVQRLMQKGYGFGAEGDWKTAALVRSMKVMAAGLEGGVSFMEDYTYHLGTGDERVLGAHMLEICPSITNGAIRCEVHPLGIGGKEDPVRLVFGAAPAQAINASIIDIGQRFRMIVNDVETVESKHSTPKLPVASALWKPLPDFTTATTCWLLAGGAHHTGYSNCLTSEHLEDFAEMAGIECLIINENTFESTFKQDLRSNQAYFN